MKGVILILLFATVLSDNILTTLNALIVSKMTRECIGATLAYIFEVSQFKSCIYQESYKKKLGNISFNEYCDRVNKGTYSANSFINDSVGFGLAQWTEKSIKQKLLEDCKGKIGDFDCQLKFLIKTMKQYGPWSILTESHNVKECTKAVLLKYARPPIQDPVIQKEIYEYALIYYDRFKY